MMMPVASCEDVSGFPLTSIEFLSTIVAMTSKTANTAGHGRAEQHEPDRLAHRDGEARVVRRAARQLRLDAGEGGAACRWVT